jgi:conjugal transfer pilus assembly protein TrbC
MRISPGTHCPVAGAASRRSPGRQRPPPVITEADLERVRREQPHHHRAGHRAGAAAGIAHAERSRTESCPRAPAKPTPHRRPAPTPAATRTRSTSKRWREATLRKSTRCRPQAEGLARRAGSLRIREPVHAAAHAAAPDRSGRARPSFGRSSGASLAGSLRTTVAQVQPPHRRRARWRCRSIRRPSTVSPSSGYPASCWCATARDRSSCASGTCAPPEAFLRTTGDVSLDYALEHMQRSGAPAFAKAMPSGFLQADSRDRRPRHAPRSSSSSCAVVVWLTLFCFVTTQTAARGRPAR